MSSDSRFSRRSASTCFFEYVFAALPASVSVFIVCFYSQWTWLLLHSATNKSCLVYSKEKKKSLALWKKGQAGTCQIIPAVLWKRYRGCRFTSRWYRRTVIFHSSQHQHVKNPQLYGPRSPHNVKINIYFFSC